MIYWVALAVATHWPRMVIHVAGQDVGSFHGDKAIHVAAFAVLTVLLYLARPLGRGASPRTQLMAVSLIAAAYGYLDEFTQPMFERTLSPTDVLSNLLGVALAMWAIGSTNALSRHSPTWARLSIVILAPLGAMMALLPSMAMDMKLPLPMGPHRLDRFELRADHLIHLIVALVGTWLLGAARPLGVTRRVDGYLTAIVLMLIAGPLTELAQIPFGRGFEWGDVIGHTLGTALASVMIAGHLIARSGGVAAKPQASSPKPQQRDAKDFVSHVRTVSGLTLVSRFTGLVRDGVLAAVFGLSSVADAFFLGFLIPNLFRRLFGEGALTAAFIPVYTDLVNRDRDLATRFASACIAGLAIVLGVITCAGEIALWAMNEYGQWTDTTSLALKLMMVMLPYMPLVCMVALVGGILQVHRCFGPAAAAPIVLNFAMIAGAMVGAYLLGGGEPHVVAFATGVAVVIAGVFQLLWQGFIMLRHEAFTMERQGIAKPVRAMLTTLLPMLIGLAVFQINAAMDTLIAFGLSAKEGGADHMVIWGRQVAYPIQAGAVGALNWSQRLYQFPLGVFGIAVATAIFPALARAAATRGEDGGSHFRDILRNGLRLTVFIGLPASVGLILVRVPLARMIFQYGKFSVEDAGRVAFILAGYATAIWAYSMTHVLTRAFYAVQDARTPLRISMVNVALNVVLNLLLIWYLGAAGLAWSTAICAAWQCVLLVRAIRRYVDAPIGADVCWSWARTTLLSAVMAAALLVVLGYVDPATLSRKGSALLLAGMVGGGAVIYVIGAIALKAEELRWLLRR